MKNKVYLIESHAGMGTCYLKRTRIELMLEGAGILGGIMIFLIPLISAFATLIISFFIFLFGGNPYPFEKIANPVLLVLEAIALLVGVISFFITISDYRKEDKEEKDKNEKEIQDKQKHDLEYNKKNFGGEIFPPTFGVHYEDDEIGEVFYHENQEPDDHEPDNGEGFIIFQKSGSKKIYMSEYLIINESYWYTWYPNPFNSNALSEAVRSASENEHLATVFENRESAIDFLKTSGKSYERLLPKKGV